MAPGRAVRGSWKTAGRGVGHGHSYLKKRSWKLLMISAAGAIVTVPALDVREQADLHAALGHGLMQRGEQLGAVVEAEAGDPHVAGGAGEQLADDDGGVAGAALPRLGAGPHEVDVGRGTLGALGDGDVEDGVDGAGVEVGERGEHGIPAVAQALGLQLDRPQRAGEAAAANGVLEGAQIGQSDEGESAHRVSSGTGAKERQLGGMTDGGHD